MAARFDVEVSLALGADITADPAGWSWTDITAYCMVREGGVTIRRGRSDWQSQVQPSTCDLLVNNADGRFSRLNPLGAYYGQLTKNTPLRVRARAVGGTLTTRFIGFVSEWPPRWEPRERHFWVPVRADGVLRRIGRITAGRMSALRRTILASDVLAYWPLEDEGPATFAYNAAGGQTMVYGGLGSMEFTTGIPGASSVLNLVADAFAFARGYATLSDVSGFQVEFVALSDQGADTAVLNIFGVEDPATFLPVGLPVTIVAAAADGLPHHFAVLLEQNGSDLDVTVYRDGVAGSPTTVTGAVIRPNVGVGPRIGQFSTGTVLIGHVAIYGFADISAPAGRAEATDGYAGEEAHDRFTRLLAEESVHGTTAAASSVRVGAQPVGTFLDVIRDLETADQGVLYEGFADPLVYQATSERYNLAVDLALDYNAGHIKQPFAMADDDRGIINDSTVTRTGGASARYEQADGPLGTDPTTGVGRVDESPTFNLYIDEQALDAASWRVHVGTNDEYRYPTVTLMFHSSSSILASWLTCDIGSRITVDNMPSNPTPDLVDQILEGYTERINSMEWHAGLNLSPYAPFLVGKYGVDAYDSRYDTAHSELGDAFVAGTDTTMPVAVIRYPLWTTNVSHVPLEVKVGGAVLEVTDIANSGVDGYSRTVANGWGDADSGQTYVLSGTNTEYAVSGGVGTITPNATGSDRMAVIDMRSRYQDASVVLETNTTPTGGIIRYGMAGRYTDANNHYRFVLSITTGGVVTAEIARRAAGVLTTLDSVATTLSIGSNITVRMQAGAGADGLLRLKAWQSASGEPDGWTLETVDLTPLTSGNNLGPFARREAGNLTPTALDFDSLNVTNPQTFTVTQTPVNGVATTLDAGTRVSLDQPAYYAL
jgi:hypothetical protein